jgi:hypothetical protein
MSEKCRSATIVVVLLAALAFPIGTVWADSVTVVTNIQAGTRGGLYIGNRAPLQPSPLLRLPVGSIQPQGWLLTMLQNQRNGLNGLQEQVSPFLKFTNSDWTTTNGAGATQGWERVPYWLRGYIDLGYCLQDAAVISNSTRWIKGVMVSQRTNGYFGPAQHYGGGTNISDLGINAPDLWPNMPMLDAMRSYYEYTGDTNAMTLMRNYCLWEASLSPTNFGVGYWPTMRMGDNIESVFWLYNRLGESWLLTLATNIYANMARWDSSGTLPNWHNVNIAECFRAPTVFWQQSGNASHLQFAEANYQVVKQQYGQVPGGAFGGDENCRFGYYGPRQAFETCGWVELMRSFEILGRITGSPVWAERLEDVAANSYPAATTTNLMELRYLTAPNQPQSDFENKSPSVQNNGTWFSYSPTIGNYYCCEHNHGMGWPYFCEETWQATWDNGLCASVYAPTAARVQVGDGSGISVTETTDFPFGDTVQLRFTTTNTVVFPLYLRVPQWCSNSWIQVNGVTVATNSRASSFVCIQRTWSIGDQVLLHFPRQITLKTWTANNNCVSVNYGPLTFSLQINENWQAYGGNAAPWTELAPYPASPWNYGIELNSTNPAASFTVVTNAGPMSSYPFSLATTPIQLQARARKIPGWTLDNLAASGPVQVSPVFCTQAVETVTLMPMGAARLRISAFPTVSTNTTATRWSTPYIASASYTNGSDTVLAMNDALLPTSSADTSIPRMTFWNHLGTAEWVRADFNGLCQVSRVSVYWYDDTGFGSVRVPQSWWVEYLAGTNWVQVSGAGTYGVAKNQFNTVQFNPVQTTAVRLRIQLQSGVSVGILEWQVPAEPVVGLATRYLLDGNVADAAAGQTGILTGGMFVADRFGAAGKALQFNGTSDFATVPRPNSMDWTIAFWVRTTATGGTPQWYNGKGLVDGEVGGVTDDFGTALVGSKAAFGVGNPDITITSTTSINDGQWHHVAAARSAYTGLMQIYVDGQLQASAVGPFGPKISPPNLRLGSIQTGASGGFLSGALDDVQIFNRVLTASEVATVMNQSLVLNPIADITQSAGQVLTVTNVAVDPYAPPRTLTWILASAPAGAAINPANGVITWRPAPAQAGSTNLFAVQVTDNGTPNLSATQSFKVVVDALARPQLSPLSVAGGVVSFQVAGDSGPDYVVEAATNLAPAPVWVPLTTNFSPVPPFEWSDAGATNFAQRFYRVRLFP